MRGSNWKRSFYDNLNRTMPFRRRKNVSAFDIIASIICSVAAFVAAWFALKWMSE